MQITYLLDDGVSDKYPIVLDPTDGSVFVRGELDRERESEFTFRVIARDGGSNSSRPNSGTDDDLGANESRANVTVLVLDANDNVPVFFGYTRLRRKEGADDSDPHAVMPIYTAEVIVLRRLLLENESLTNNLFNSLCSSISSLEPGLH